MVTPTTPPTATALPGPKPGWKTSEFWLSLAAKVLGALFSAGVLGDGSTAMRVAGVAAIVLSTLGYQVSRTIVKSAAALVLLFALAHTASACGPSSREKTIQTTLTATNAASAAFVEYDKLHQADIVTRAANRSDGEAQLGAWRTTQREVLVLFSDAYRTIAAAAVANDDPSLAAMASAAGALTKTLHDIGATK